jgi:hypothetical protein
MPSSSFFFLRFLRLFAAALSVLPIGGVAAAETPVGAEVVSVATIWDAAPHCAFTDLVRFRDQWYCAFREGEKHVSKGGKLRVIRSADGEEWESAGLLELADYDLRDACLSVMPDGRLMLLGGAQQATENSHPTGTVVSFSEDGAAWTPPKIVLPLGQWLWRVTWHGDKAYGVAYATMKTAQYSILETSDGLEYRELPMASPPPGGYLTEARLRFDSSGNCLCLQRRDGTSNSAFLAKVAPPYRDWEWTDLGKFFGGPNFIETPAGDWIAAGRIMDGGAHTAVAWLDAEKGQLVPLAKLPSGGDTSYPGMVSHDDLLWLTYYSSHEGGTKIYLAKVRVTPKS